MTSLGYTLDRISRVGFIKTYSYASQHNQILPIWLDICRQFTEEYHDASTCVHPPSTDPIWTSSHDNASQQDRLCEDFLHSWTGSIQKYLNEADLLSHEARKAQMRRILACLIAHFPTTLSSCPMQRYYILYMHTLLELDHRSVHLDELVIHCYSIFTCRHRLEFYDDRYNWPKLEERKAVALHNEMKERMLRASRRYFLNNGYCGVMDWLYLPLELFDKYYRPDSLEKFYSGRHFFFNEISPNLFTRTNGFNILARHSGHVNALDHIATVAHLPAELTCMIRDHLDIAEAELDSPSNILKRFRSWPISSQWATVWPASQETVARRELNKKKRRKSKRVSKDPRPVNVIWEYVWVQDAQRLMIGHRMRSKKNCPFKDCPQVHLLHPYTAPGFRHCRSFPQNVDTGQRAHNALRKDGSALWIIAPEQADDPPSQQPPCNSHVYDVARQYLLT